MYSTDLTQPNTITVKLEETAAGEAARIDLTSVTETCRTVFATSTHNPKDKQFPKEVYRELGHDQYGQMHKLRFVC